MKRMWSAAFVIVVASAAVGAQSGKEMDKSMKGDKAPTTYTGCVESVNHGGSYLLTHLTEEHQMGMGHDGTMKKDSGMPADHMMPSALVLTGPANLRKHVGRKVTVTGSLSKGATGTLRSDLDTLTVTSLKIAAKACS